MGGGVYGMLKWKWVYHFIFFPVFFNAARIQKGKNKAWKMVGRVSAGRPLCLPSSSRCLFFPREGVLISGAKVLISEKSWRLSHLQRQKSVSQTFIRRHLCKESASSFPGHLWQRRPLPERQQGEAAGVWMHKVVSFLFLFAFVHRQRADPTGDLGSACWLDSAGIKSSQVIQLKTQKKSLQKGFWHVCSGDATSSRLLDVFWIVSTSSHLNPLLMRGIFCFPRIKAPLSPRRLRWCLPEGHSHTASRLLCFTLC